ncbi:MAG: crossover junction endodeoxyribonuclease RuvC [Chthoniobacterales bacterium]
MRILAVDPSLRGTGIAVLEEIGSKVRCLEYSVVRNRASLSQEACLVAIHEALVLAITKHQPAALAIEKVIFVQSYATAIVLGAARGVAVLAAAQAGLSIHEYPPKRVKQAVVGKGAAAKEQVAFMIRALLGLTETPPSDAADAIAIGLTHLRTISSPVLKVTATRTR